MTYFSAEALADLREQSRSVPGKQAALQARYLQKVFLQDRAREFAHHGYVRRLNTLARCIENVFTLIPPERTEPIDSKVKSDAEINIQASVFNVFAAADNLAWIWVVEKAVRKEDGTELPDTWVGLRRTNRAVRAALPQKLREYVASMDAWFDMVDNYRHALAHRIPLYIPPYMVDPANEAAYQALETAKNVALFSRGNLEEHDRARADQKQMEFFRPWMLHSIGEGARPLVFHPQLIANFNTIEEMGRKFLDALDA
jgi:hypothetical protein